MSMYEGLWKYIKSYKFNSIFIKNFLILMLLLVIPLSSLVVGVYVYYYNMLRQEITAANNNSLTRVVDLFDMVMRETDKLSVRIASDPYVTEFSKGSGTGLGSFDFFQRAQEIFRTLNLSTITSDYINSIYVYSESGDYVLSSVLASDTGEKFSDMGWLETYKELKKDKLNLEFNTRFYRNLTQDTDEKQMISSVRGLPMIGDSVQGAVVVNINADILSDQLNKVNSQLQQNILIVDTKGNIIFSGDKKLINTNISEINLQQEIHLSSTEYHGILSDVNGEKQIISIIKSSNNQLYYISMIPLQIFEMKLTYLKEVMFWLIIVCVLMAVIIALIFSLNVYQPVKNIITILEDPGNENLRNRLGSKFRFDEFKFIAKNLIERSDKNHEMEQELGTRMVMLKKAQSIALQSQINPHFLYNTLETVNWMAMSKLGHNNPISSMLTSLSHLLRLSLETEEGIIPVRMEIEHAQWYLKIQQIRYNNKFTVEWDISSDVLDMKILKLTFQPLLENAIYHDIKPKKDQGKISIRGCRENDLIAFEIEDDGVGMDADTLNRLNKELTETNSIKEGEHIGIMNVNQRYKLAFGNDYGLLLKSSPGIGTVVKIILPVIQNDKFNEF